MALEVVGFGQDRQTLRPASAYRRAWATASTSARIIPTLGEARLTSAMTVSRPGTCRDRRKPGKLERPAKAASSASVTGRANGAISRRLASMISVSLSTHTTETRPSRLAIVLTPPPETSPSGHAWHRPSSSDHCPATRPRWLPLGSRADAPDDLRLPSRGSLRAPAGHRPS